MSDGERATFPVAPVQRRHAMTGKIEWIDCLGVSACGHVWTVEHIAAQRSSGRPHQCADCQTALLEGPIEPVLRGDISPA